MHKRGQGSSGGAMEEGKTWVGQGQKINERRKNKFIEYEVFLGRNTKKIRNYQNYGRHKMNNS